MRTTLDIDAALLNRIRRVARERGEPFKGAVNRLLRTALEGPTGKGKKESSKLPEFSLGGLVVDSIRLDKAMALAAALDDEAVVSKLEQRK